MFNRRSYGSNRDRRQRPGGREPFVFALLLGELWRIIEPLPVKPVVTIILIAFQVWVHFFTNMASDFIGINFANIQRYCLYPRKVWESASGSLSGGGSTSMWRWFSFVPAVKESLRFPWARIFVSSIMHADDWHLYYNMLSFCVKGVQLEGAYGPEMFFLLILYSVLVSHLMAVLLSKCMLELSIMAIWNLGVEFDSGYESCAVGFSAVIFCLKYIVNFGADSTTRMQVPIFGGFHRIPLFNVPTKYAAWIELVVISLVTPNASFMGHLAGILAGVLWVSMANKAGVLWVHALDANDRISKLLQSLFRGGPRPPPPRPTYEPPRRTQEAYDATTGTASSSPSSTFRPSQEDMRRRRTERYQR